MIHGIDVIVVVPGEVKTAIWDKAEKVDISGYKDTEYGSSMEPFRQYMLKNGRKGYAPEHLGEIIWKALTTPHPPVRYGYAVVPNPLRNWVLPHLLPKRRFDALIAQNLGWKRK
jgi:hypothetical protein